MPELEGAADALMVADASTWRVLPWAPRTGWLLCDLRFPGGKPVPFDTRGQLRQALAALDKAGYGYRAGLEIEFHIFRILDARCARRMRASRVRRPRWTAVDGYQLLSETRYDQLEPALEVLRANLAGLGLPLRSFECEFGPSQAEVTLGVQEGLAAADAMILFRSATKQILRRHGYHRYLHVPPQAAQRDVERMASAPEPRQGREECFCFGKGFPLGDREAFSRRPPGTRRGLGGLRHADHQRLQALSPYSLAPSA